MGQAGVSTAPQRRTRERAWVDFGVDGTWEPARRRRITGRPGAEHRDALFDGDAMDGRFDAIERERRLEAEDAFPPPPVAAARAAVAVATVESAPQSPRSAPAAPRSARRVRPNPEPLAATPLSPRSLPEPSTASHTRLPDPAISDVTPAASQPPARRTVTIRGRGAERELAFPSHGTPRRPATRRHERPGFKPDRTAMWAVLLGILLVLVAATSSHAAVLHHAPALHHPAASAVRLLTAPGAP